MASLLAPTTPKRSTLERSVLQRSFTLPASITSAQSRSGLAVAGTPEGVETLFVHPSARIVSFTTSLKSAASTPSSSPSAREQAFGEISWQNSTERTIAAGHLEIYRVPGSVSFLHSGTLLHAILPRSQCWCVDGVSKFAFRVLPETYYRIELPSESDEDKERVERLITTLKLVLFYERTPCPFRRGFQVDLDDDNLALDRQLQRRPSDRNPEPAKKWKLDGIWRPEDQTWARRLELKTGRSYTKAEAESQATTFEHAPLQATMAIAAQTNVPGLPRASHLAHFRSVTAPPAWSMPKSPIIEATSQDVDGQAESLAGQCPDMLEAHNQSPDSIPTSSSNTTPTQPEAKPEIYDPSTIDSDELSDHVSGGSPEPPPKRGLGTIPTSAPSSSPPSFWSPSLHDDDDFWGAAPISPPRGYLSHTRYATVSGSHDSRVVSSNGSPEQVAENMAKSYARFLGPPAQLVSVMLRIAAKLATDALSMTINTPSGNSKHVPGSWELSDDEDDWDMGDYGFPLRSERS